MKRISLILPLSSAESYSEAWVSRCREALETDGSIVDVIAALPPGVAPLASGLQAGTTWSNAPKHGLVASAMQGLLESDGDYRVILDGADGYLPEELAKVVAPLVAGDADIVVAWRKPVGLTETFVAMLSKPLLKASDPLAGLVALTSEKARELAGRFHPVGSRFTIDLLLRLKARKVEAPIGVDATASRRIPLGLDDLRHIKRLADDHYGNISRLIQFCVVGASGMVVDLTCYAILQLLLAKTVLSQWQTPWLESSLDLTVAAALAIAAALTWNFSLNRRLTFSYARHGSILHQFLIYGLSNALGIGLSFTLRLYLPARIDFFARHRLAAAVVGIVAATGISFSMARWIVFRGGHEPVAAEIDDSAFESTMIESTNLIEIDLDPRNAAAKRKG